MSIMISNTISNTIRNSAPDPAQAPAVAEDTKKVTGTQAPDEAGHLEGPKESHPLAPVTDEYIPEEKKEPTGCYWMKTDENGKKPESCTANTDKVDREIERLKKKLAELEQQLNTETDERKIKQLESELAQVQNELRQKDNDTYRRQHTQFTYS